LIRKGNMMTDTELAEAVEKIRKERLVFDQASKALIASMDHLYSGYKEVREQLSSVREDFDVLQYHASNERRKDVGVIRSLRVKRNNLVFNSPGLYTTDESWPEKIQAAIISCRGEILNVRGQISRIRAITSLWRGYKEPSTSAE
jgi:hypothetical protein